MQSSGDWAPAAPAPANLAPLLQLVQLFHRLTSPPAPAPQQQRTPLLPASATPADPALADAPLPAWANFPKVEDCTFQWWTQDQNAQLVAAANADPSRRLDLVMWGDSLTAYHSRWAGGKAVACMCFWARVASVQLVRQPCCRRQRCAPVPDAPAPEPFTPSSSLPTVPSPALPACTSPPPCRPGKRVTWQKYFEGLAAVPMGICGSTVENLVYRLLAKGERLAVGPKVVVYWIG